MSTVSAFDQLLNRTPLSSKVFAYKVFDFTEQVNVLLAQRGWSRRDLAKKLGKTDGEVSKWLSGVHNLTLESIAKLEAAFETDLLVTPREPEGYFGNASQAARTEAPKITFGIVTLDLSAGQRVEHQQHKAVIPTTEQAPSTAFKMSVVKDSPVPQAA